jgi:hypothetical protein
MYNRQNSTQIRRIPVKRLLILLCAFILIAAGCGSPATITPQPTLAPVTPTEMPPTSIPATATPTPDITAGLVVYYPFNGDANDEGGNGVNGQIINTTGTGDRIGQDNGALLFNGVDSLVVLPDNDRLDLTGDFSISFFIKGNSTSTHEWLIMTKHRAGVCQPANTSWMLRYNTDYGLRLINYDTTVECGKTILSAPEVNLKDDLWHHVVIVYESQARTISLYMDGSFVTSMDASQLNIQNNDESFVIGNQSNGVPAHNLDAAIDDLRIYDQAINEDIIEAIYRGTP